MDVRGEIIISPHHYQRVRCTVCEVIIGAAPKDDWGQIISSSTLIL
jgi:hypothetical protein